VRSITELAEAADYRVAWPGDIAPALKRLEEDHAWMISIIKKGLPVEADIKKQIIRLGKTPDGFIVRVRMNVSGAKIGQIANALTGQDIENGRADIERDDMYVIAGQIIRSLADS